MHNSDKLIPAKFLTLVAHFAITVTLLWSLQENDRDFSQDSQLPGVFANHHSQLVLSLSLTLGFIMFELFAFIIGLTMFNSSSALISIGCHGFACLMLSYLIFGAWTGAILWIVICSIAPVVNDLIIITDVILNKRY